MPGVTFTLTFQGAAASRWALTACMASSGSCPGARRTLMRARALGTSALAAPSTLGASMPITLIDGLPYSRWPMEPLPMRPTPSSTPASVR